MAQLHTSNITQRPGEGAFFQTLRAAPQAAAIPEEYFNQRTGTITKDKQMPTQSGPPLACPC